MLTAILVRHPLRGHPTLRERKKKKRVKEEVREKEDERVES